MFYVTSSLYVASYENANKIAFGQQKVFTDLCIFCKNTQNVKAKQ